MDKHPVFTKVLFKNRFSSFYFLLLQKNILMAQTSDTDPQFIESLSKGDRRAFSALFESNYRLMYAIAIKYLKDEDAAMDAVQNTFLKLWEKRTSLNFDANLHSLLYTMLKNGILNEIRNNRLHYEKIYRAAQMQDEPLTDPEVDDPGEKYLTLLNDAVSRLPDKQRLVCELKLGRKLSNMEIAEQLGITVATVKVHYYKALQTLRKIKNQDLTVYVLILQATLSVYL